MTICAPATATGGALAIVRVSGPEAIRVWAEIAGPQHLNDKGGTAHFLRLKDVHGQLIDEAVGTVWRAPHSYTGEDSLELSLHGSPYIVEQTITLLLAHGCRMAQPGEFTQRAFLNGKIDLSQAEAVAALIAAHNKASHDVAISQMRGHFSSQLSDLRQQLLHLIALLELELDFSDHEDLQFANRQELLSLTQHIHTHITSLAQSFATGKALREGIPVAIVGKPNVGKSTLLNRLLHDERAIVSPIPGTTRDTIEDHITINGVNFRMVDTAGLRRTTDEIEQQGIQRTKQAIEKARIIVWLTDEEPTTELLNEIEQNCENKSVIVVRNKIDQNNWEKRRSAARESIIEKNTSHQTISVSAKQGTNIELLEQAIYSAAQLPELTQNQVIVTSQRHYQALQQAQQHCQNAIHALNTQLPPDLIAEHLHATAEDLAEITGGQITTQETLNTIFSEFCIGK